MGWMNRLLDNVRLTAKPQIVVAPDLQEVEQASADPDWIRAKAYIRERLVSLRRGLESTGLSHAETEGARYAIIELEGVLNFQKPSKMAENASE